MHIELRQIVKGYLLTLGDEEYAIKDEEAANFVEQTKEFCKSVERGSLSADEVDAILNPPGEEQIWVRLPIVNQ